MLDQQGMQQLSKKKYFISIIIGLVILSFAINLLGTVLAYTNHSDYLIKYRKQYLTFCLSIGLFSCLFSFIHSFIRGATQSMYLMIGNISLLMFIALHIIVQFMLCGTNKPNSTFLNIHKVVVTTSTVLISIALIMYSIHFSKLSKEDMILSKEDKDMKSGEEEAYDSSDITTDSEVSS